MWAHAHGPAVSVLREKPCLYSALVVCHWKRTIWRKPRWLIFYHAITPAQRQVIQEYQSMPLNHATSSRIMSSEGIMIYHIIYGTPPLNPQTSKAWGRWWNWGLHSSQPWQNPQTVARHPQRLLWRRRLASFVPWIHQMILQLKVRGHFTKGSYWTIPTSYKCYGELPWLPKKNSCTMENTHLFCLFDCSLQWCPPA